jgi:hypothetical protein
VPRSGAAIVCYSPLGRGFLAQAFTKRDELAANDWRLTQPRYSEERFAENAQRAGAIKALADARSVTPAQLALAWLWRRATMYFPSPERKLPRARWRISRRARLRWRPPRRPQSPRPCPKPTAIATRTSGDSMMRACKRPAAELIFEIDREFV